MSDTHTGGHENTHGPKQSSVGTDPLLFVRWGLILIAVLILASYIRGYREEKAIEDAQAESLRQQQMQNAKVTEKAGPEKTIYIFSECGGRCKTYLKITKERVWESYPQGGPVNLYDSKGNYILTDRPGDGDSDGAILFDGNYFWGPARPEDLRPGETPGHAVEIWQ